MVYRQTRSSVRLPATDLSTPPWTIWWDMHRRGDAASSSRAMESSQDEALQRAERFLKLGFVVYAIRDPKGEIFMTEAQIAERFGRVLATATADTGSETQS